MKGTCISQLVTNLDGKGCIFYSYSNVQEMQIHHVDYSSDDVAFRNKLYTYLKTCWILNQIRCAYKIVKIA